MKREPFWRAFRAGVRLPVEYHGRGLPMVTLFDDGNGFRPITDIEWTMFFAFGRFDAILQDAHRRLDEILPGMTHATGPC
jgi:hypothetical protein